MSQHGIGFVESFDSTTDRLGLDLQGLGQLLLGFGIMRKEFVKRWVQQTNRDRKILHGGEDSYEVLALKGKKLGERLLAVVAILREDHFTHDGDAISLEEHVLRPGEHWYGP